MVKLVKVGLEGTYLNVIKAIENWSYEKPIAKIILNSEKLKSFLLKSGKDSYAQSYYLCLVYYWKS